MGITVNDVEKKLKQGIYQKKPKQGKSDIWNSFSIVCENNGKELDFVSCDKCAKLLVYNGHRSGTSGLRRHICSVLPGQSQTMTEAKRAFSMVWDHFTLVTPLTTPRKVQCSLCSQRLSFNKNTSAMLRHLRSRHPSEAWYSTSNNSPSGPGPHASFPSSARLAAGTDRFNASLAGAAGATSMLANAAGVNSNFYSIIKVSTRQEDLDEALVNMLIKDSQPFSLVEDEGFCAFVQKLDPDYVLPAKRRLKSLVASQCDVIKENIASEVEKADYVSLTSDMWTSADNKESYVSVTGHLVTEASQLATFLLGISKLPENHKALHVDEVKNQLVAGWGLHGRVAAFVSEQHSGESMAATVQKLGMLQLPSFAQVLNVTVRRAVEATRELQEIRSQARTVVALFKTNPTAKERLLQVQGQLNREGQKLIQEVDSRWNSSFFMLQRLFDQRESVAAALSTLDTDITPLGSADYEVIHQCLGVLDPFNQATAELSAETRVSASKVIPLIRMLRMILEEKHGAAVHPTAALLASNLQRTLHTSCSTVETEPVLALSTLLDPRFKVLAFGNPGNAQEAVKVLTSECAALIRVVSDLKSANDLSAYLPSTSSSASPPHSSSSVAWASPVDSLTASVSLSPPPVAASSRAQGGGLWELFDSKVGDTQSVQSSTADAAVEVQRYLSDAYLNRGENPMHYWERHSKVYPNLFKLARKYLSIPAGAVPGQRTFTKAGDAFSKKRSCLSMRTVEQLMLLNEGFV